jgi:NAD(P)-dependent dehydrogenase (short-subunit alcohol dehydrogenase family)
MSAERELYLLDKRASVDGVVKPCDLSRPERIDEAVASLPFGSIDRVRCLVSTGVYDGQTTGLPDWENVSRSLQVNLVGPTQFCIGVVRRVLQAQIPLRLVVVSSAAAAVGSADLGYGTAKAGLHGLSRSISKRYAHQGITAIAVAPGIFPSAMSQGQASSRQAAAIGATHLRRVSSLDEVATVAAYALLEAPDAMTGTVVSPNGGQV